jgi:hypothetical protein
MDWYRIDWQGAYPVETAHTKSGAKGYGIYAMYGVKGKNPKLLYVGETYRQSFGERLKQHKKDWLFRVNDKVVIHFGKIILPEGKRISSDVVFDVEATFIHILIPPFNTISKHGYHGRDLMLINTGKIGTLNPIMGSRELVLLLRGMMKKTK